MSQSYFRRRLSHLLKPQSAKNEERLLTELNSASDHSQDFSPVFIGGAGRTGTTLVHALICTSPLTNPFIEECSYFADLVAALPHALASFELHNRYYFDSPGELMRYHGDILKSVLSDFWIRLGKPKLLVLKQPLMTRHFHFLAQIMPTSRFVVMVRDPRDVIQSRLEVNYKIGLYNPDSVSADDIDVICSEFNEYYDTIINHPELFGDRLLYVSYERLVADEEARRNEEAQRIAAFLGVDALQPELLWKRAITKVGDAKSDPWSTPLYGQDVTSASVGRHEKMAPTILSRVMARCGATAEVLSRRSSWDERYHN